MPIAQSRRPHILLAAFAATAMLALSAGNVRAANAAEERCDHYVERGIFANKGACMKRFNTGPVNWCKYLEDWGYYDKPWARFKNKGECISSYKKS